MQRTNRMNRLPIHEKLQFGNLAMLYYPDKAYKTAVRLFRKEFEDTPGLLEALKEAGYKLTQRVLNRRQVQIVEDYLGPMD